MSVQPLQITVVQGSILEVEAQVIVNAANSLGVMGGGVAGGDQGKVKRKK
jgi:O-acetyl-ADP-ribose deacetylase (regulator of RNase III)